MECTPNLSECSKNQLTHNSGKIDILETSASKFHLELREESNVLFSTNLDEINKELDMYSKTHGGDEENLQEFYDNVPNFLQKDDLFVKQLSRRAPDTLPPRRQCDYRIEITSDKALRYGPLYSQIDNELKVLKK